MAQGKHDPSVKQYHVFVSYRVATDAALAERLVDKLQQLEIEREASLRIKCFLDKQDLKFGENWEEGFLAGLVGSCLFVPLFSEASLQYLVDSRPGVKDNCLLEYETALRLFNEEKIDILPIFVGSSPGGVYKKFSGFGFPFPEHSSATNPSGTIRQTLMTFFKLQGIFLSPDELKDKLGVVQHRLSIETWPRFRNGWANTAELGPERMYRCVQCSDEYMESQNGEGHCSFHQTGLNNSVYHCCNQKHDPPRLYQTPGPFIPKPGQPNRPPAMQEIPGARDAIAKYKVPGCTRKRHRSSHHYDYPYENWYMWVNSITNYTDTRDVWTGVEAPNLNTGSPLYFEMGKVLKGSSKGGMYIHMSGNKDRKRFFKVFDAEAINQIESLAIAKALRNAERDVAATGSFNPNKLVQLDGETFENENGKAQFVWDIVNDKLAGVTATLTSPTAPQPTAVRVLFDIEPDVRKVDVKVLSVAKVTEKAPSRPYVLPTAPWYKGEFVPVIETRAAQKDFKTYGDLNGRMKLNSIECNEWRSSGSDIFTAKVTFVNADATTPISLVDVACQYALMPVNNNASAAEVEWKPFEHVTATVFHGEEDKKIPLPQKVDASGTLTLGLRLKAPVPELPNCDAIYNYSMLARTGPILIRVTVEAADGHTASLPIEWVNTMPLVYLSPSEGEEFVVADDKTKYAYEKVSVNRQSSPVSVTVYGFNRSCKLEEKELREAAFRASQATDPRASPFPADVTAPATALVRSLGLPWLTAATYHRLEGLCNDRAGFSSEVGVLVDPACLRAVGVMIALVSPTVSVIQHFALPLYGETATTQDTPHFTSALAVPAGFKEKRDEPPRKIRPVGPVAWLGNGTAPATSSPATTGVVSGSGASLAQIEAALAAVLDRRMSALESKLQALEASLTARLDRIEASVAGASSSASSVSTGAEAAVDGAKSVRKGFFSRR